MKKNLIIAGLILTIAVMLVAGASEKKANELHEYATANNCTWVYQGTAYGDDRDYICK